MKRVLSFTLNGDPIEVVCKDNMTLLDLLRDKLGLTCMILTVECDGSDILTIEGLEDPATHALDPIQQAFIDKYAFQCGYCTPGMIMSAKALLDVNPHPTELEIREAIEGNLCRCTGYAKIVEAIQAAAAEMNWEEGK